MAKKNRSPVQMGQVFKKKLDDLQRKIMMARGEKESLREIGDKLVSDPLFQEIEKNMIKATKEVKLDIKIKFDRRFGE